MKLHIYTQLVCVKITNGDVFASDICVHLSVCMTLDIQVMAIVWTLRVNIIRTALCWIV